MMQRILSTLLALSLFTLPAAALADEAPPPKGRLAFIAMTGPEDVGTLSSSFRHALAAKKSGHLEDVVWLSWGRGVVALDPKNEVVPESVREHARAAKDGGVRLVACAQALKKWGIDRESLSPGAEVVENGVDEMARLIREGYEIIRY